MRRVARGILNGISSLAAEGIRQHNQQRLSKERGTPQHYIKESRAWWVLESVASIWWA